MNRDHSVIFEIAPNYCILDLLLTVRIFPFLLSDSYPQQQMYWTSELNLPIPIHFSSLISKILIHSCYLLYDYFQFSLIRGPNIPGSLQHCFLQHQTLLSPSDIFTTGHCGCLVWLSLYSLWSYFPALLQQHIGHILTPFISFVSYLFAFSQYSWDSQSKNAEEVHHSLLQGTTFCQNSLF